MVKKSLILLFVCFSYIANADQEFYRDKERGWFWREQPPVVEELPEELPPELPPAPPPPPPKEVKLEEVRPFSSKWLRENMDKLKDAAIDQPTPDNVSAYYYAQRIAIDKSQRFAEVAMNAVEADPFLDSNSMAPLATAGKNLIEAEANRNEKELLKEIAQKSGIWFFYREDCSFCHLQANILNSLVGAYGFKIMPISMDGSQLNESFPNFKVNTGQAEAMGVTSTPTLILATPPNKLVMLGEGFLAFDELMKRIINQAPALGLITNEQRDSTRKSKINLVPDDVGRDIAESDIKSPQDIKKYILKAMKEKK